MTDIKIFRCGLCKEKDRIGRTRHDLRKHLREEHGITKNITNFTYVAKRGYQKQNWWIEE